MGTLRGVRHPVWRPAEAGRVARHEPGPVRHDADGRAVRRGRRGARLDGHPGARRSPCTSIRGAIQGFECPRSEVSGRRLWGWAAARFGTAERFFRDWFVLNYCPLALLEASGRNYTPDKLPAALLRRSTTPAIATSRRRSRRCAGMGHRHRRVRREADPRGARGNLDSRSHGDRVAAAAPEPGEPGGEPGLGRSDGVAARRARRPNDT